VFSIVLAALSYRWVERPWRRRDGLAGRLDAGALGGLCLVLASALAAAGLAAYVSGGWPQRFRAEVQPLLVDLDAVRAERRRALVASERRASSLPGAHRVVVIGDSHATDVLNALDAQGAAPLALTRLGVLVECQPALEPHPEFPPHVRKRCRRSFQRLLRKPALAAAHTVVLSARWRAWAADRLPQTLAAIAAHTDARIVVFGPTVEFEPEVPVLVATYANRTNWVDLVNRHQVAERRELALHLAQQSARAGVEYIDKIALLCPGGRCPLVVAPGASPMFVDYGHWSVPGAHHFGRALRAAHPDLFAR
jgi:hypothetical protein